MHTHILSSTDIHHPFPRHSNTHLNSRGAGTLSFNRFCPFSNLQQFSIIILTLLSSKYAIVIVCRVVEKVLIHHPLNLNKVIENRGSYSFLTSGCCCSQEPAFGLKKFKRITIKIYGPVAVKKNLMVELDSSQAEGKFKDKKNEDFTLYSVISIFTDHKGVGLFLPKGCFSFETVLIVKPKVFFF